MIMQHECSECFYCTCCVMLCDLANLGLVDLWLCTLWSVWWTCYIVYLCSLWSTYHIVNLWSMLSICNIVNLWYLWSNCYIVNLWSLWSTFYIVNCELVVFVIFVNFVVLWTCYIDIFSYWYGYRLYFRFRPIPMFFCTELPFSMIPKYRCRFRFRNYRFR